MKKITGLCVIAIFAIASCNPATPSPISEAEIQTAVAKTQAAQGLVQTLAVQTFAAITPSPTQTPTETPLPTSTNTPEPPPSVTTTQNVYCRSGPGDVYLKIALINEGETLIIEGQLDGQPWWRVQPPDKDPCWLPASAVEVSGNTNSVAVFPIPPTPGPVGTSLVIQYGQTLSGELWGKGHALYYAFLGRAGDNVSVLLSGATTNVYVGIDYPSINSHVVGKGTRTVGDGGYISYNDALISNYVIKETAYYYIAVILGGEYGMMVWHSKFTLTLTKN